MMEIEERLRARAGNPSFKEKPAAQPKPERVIPEKKEEPKAETKLGEGITKESVDKVIREFKF